jgi:hypothetical protein
MGIMSIKFSGKYDRNLFFKAVRIANRPVRRPRWVQPMILVVISVSACILVIRLLNTRDILGNASYIVVVLLAAGFQASSFFPPYLAARKLWVNPAVQETLSGTITELGITYDLNIGQNKMPWNRFIRVQKAASFTTLVTRDGLLVIFPSKFFITESDWRKFNQFVDSKVLTMH